MNSLMFLSFVSCPNPDHVKQEGWKSRQLYYAGNGIYKCGSCGKEFTREEIRLEIQKDYAYRLQDLQRDYQQHIAKLYKDKQETLDEFDNIGERSEGNGPE
jgi:hypothetical protein